MSSAGPRNAAALIVVLAAVTAGSAERAATALDAHCREAITESIGQWRHVRLDSVEAAPRGARIVVVVSGVDEKTVAPLLGSVKDGLDRFGLPVASLRSRPAPKDDPKAYAFEIVVSCGKPDDAPPEVTLACGAAPASPCTSPFDGIVAANPTLHDVKATMAAGQVKVTGAANEISDVAGLLAAMQGCAAFADVDLKLVKLNAQGSYDFEIAAGCASAAR